MQKKILALHDLAGLGRSSLVPIIAVLSAAADRCLFQPPRAAGLAGLRPHGQDAPGVGTVYIARTPV